MKHLIITTREQVITRTAAAFEVDIDSRQGALIATGFDEQGEKSCVVVAARGEWVSVEVDAAPSDAPEPAETTTDADTGETQRTVFVDVTPFIPADLRERIEAVSTKCACVRCTLRRLHDAFGIDGEEAPNA